MNITIDTNSKTITINDFIKIDELHRLLVSMNLEGYSIISKITNYNYIPPIHINPYNQDLVVNPCKVTYTNNS